MKPVHKALFKALHEGYWLSIEYRNASAETTRYWIAVTDLNAETGRLQVQGMHLGNFALMNAELYIDRILSAEVLEGTYAPVNEKLVSDILSFPNKYAGIFPDTDNLRILNYLAECYRLDSTPYKKDFSLISSIDDELLKEGTVALNREQFAQIVRSFQKEKDGPAVLQMKQIAMNLLSIHTSKGLYVLAARPLRLDPVARTLQSGGNILICSEFTVNGERQSIRRFLDADETGLLNDFERNAEVIRDIITLGNPSLQVDDMPYLMEICRTPLLDLEEEYEGILRQFETKPTVPVQAFFGNLTARPSGRRKPAIVLPDHNINLDQLTAINHALRYPLSYIQGPPGTGKTLTISNIILSAFYNKRTVLLSSYNNHPVDEVLAKLSQITWQGKPVPFPFVRLGNQAEVLRTLNRLKPLCEEILSMPAPRRPAGPVKTDSGKALQVFLDRYEERLDLLERKETAEELLNSSEQMNFQIELQVRQLPGLEKRIEEIGELSIEEALRLLPEDTGRLPEILRELSLQHFRRLTLPENEELYRIIRSDNESTKVRDFNQYISDPENLKNFLSVFPVIATTCVSAHKLGTPDPVFDMVILDEAGQCNTAVSLVPVLRGKELLLVGDPQQLRPVILLSEEDNIRLRRKYSVPAEYDYRLGSIYQTFLACDPISDEVLLSHHYRCDPRIIGFNNRKYYNHKLVVESPCGSQTPLEFVDVPETRSAGKNISVSEADAIIAYIQDHPEENIGIITPFVNQRQFLKEELERHRMNRIECGTVHAFQGDEKDTILFSLSLNQFSRPETYAWLKNNNQLINVSTSRARKKLVLFGNSSIISSLHGNDPDDDLYDLVQYVKTAGTCRIQEHSPESRALGIRPYSTETEMAFLENLNHALENAFRDGRNFTVHKEVPLSQVFIQNSRPEDYFFKGRFDFVVFRRIRRQEIPVLAIELDGKEHQDSETVRRRDERKNALCRDHGFELIRVDNTYARRYHFIKEILIDYFRG